MASLKNKWVLITGASSGFGAAAAMAFGAAGAKLLLGARRVNRLKTVAAAAKKSGAAEAHFHELDVSKTASVEEFISWAEKLVQSPKSKAQSPQLFDGACEGKIIFEPRGQNGFGYDPLFVPDGFTQSFAELGEDVKNKLSHREKALEKLKSYFSRLPT